MYAHVSFLRLRSVFSYRRARLVGRLIAPKFLIDGGCTAYSNESCTDSGNCPALRKRSQGRRLAGPLLGVPAGISCCGTELRLQRGRNPPLRDLVVLPLN